MSDYTYWQNALEGKFGPIHDGDPQPGFYRKRISRAGPFFPVAIWEDGGTMVAVVNGKAADPSEIWTYVCQHPVTEDAYHAKMRGEPWPDESAAVTESLAPPPIGHNEGPTDPADVLKAQIEAASTGAAEYAEVNDDEAAAKAQSLRSRLLELSGEADKKREAEKKPFFEAGKAIDTKYQPLVKAAKAAADTIRAAISAHETRKMRAAEEVARKAREAETERHRQAALNASPVSGPDAVLPAAEPPQAPAPLTTSVRGAYGRAANIKVVKVAKIVDQDAAYAMLRTHKELIELMGKLAQRATDAGIIVPGVEVTEERKVS